MCLTVWFLYTIVLACVHSVWASCHLAGGLTSRQYACTQLCPTFPRRLSIPLWPESFTREPLFSHSFIMYTVIPVQWQYTVCVHMSRIVTHFTESNGKNTQPEIHDRQKITQIIDVKNNCYLQPNMALSAAAYLSSFLSCTHLLLSCLFRLILSVFSMTSLEVSWLQCFYEVWIWQMC